MTHFTGVWPAMITPLTAEDHINEAVARRLTDHLVAQGVSGLYLCGSTGEGILLPLAERERMAEVVVEQTAGRVPVMVHVGAAATADAETLAAHAQEVGADAVSSVPPFYYGVGFREVKEHYHAIALASSLPLYLYYIPGSTGIQVTAEQMWELCQLPNVRGFKYTDYNMYLLEQIMALSKGALNILSGPDELFLPFQAVGVDGAIGTTYNLLPAHYVRLYDAFHQGDIQTARQLQSQANRVIDIFIRHGRLSAVKEMMRMLGFDCGFCRRPLGRLTETAVAALRADLDAVGFLDLAR